MHRGRDLCRLLTASIAFATCTCEFPGSPDQAQSISQACLEAIAADALTNSRTNFIAANLAGPMGLVPSSDPNAPPYLSKQVEFPTRDRTMHYFAVDSAQWAKAVLIRIAPTQSQPRSFFYVIDRRGTLMAAGRIENGSFATLDIRDTRVRADMQTEQRLWAEAGPAFPCRRER